MRRIQFNFTDQAYETLVRLRTQLNVSSSAEVVRRALAVLSLFADTRDSGKQIIIRDVDGTETKLILI
jgi:hypothetical protein